MTIAVTADPEAPGPLTQAGPANGIDVTIDSQQSGSINKALTRIVAEFRSGYTEVVYENQGLTPMYAPPPGPPVIGFEPPGLQFINVKRHGGWPTSFTLHVFAVTVT